MCTPVLGAQVTSAGWGRSRVESNPTTRPRAEPSLAGARNWAKKLEAKREKALTHSLTGWLAQGGVGGARERMYAQSPRQEVARLAMMLINCFITNSSQFRSLSLALFPSALSSLFHFRLRLDSHLALWPGPPPIGLAKALARFSQLSSLFLSRTQICSLHQRRPIFLARACRQDVHQRRSLASGGQLA